MTPAAIVEMHRSRGDDFVTYNFLVRDVKRLSWGYLYIKLFGLAPRQWRKYSEVRHYRILFFESVSNIENMFVEKSLLCVRLSIQQSICQSVRLSFSGR